MIFKLGSINIIYTYITSYTYMAQQYEFSNGFVRDEGNELEHYRIEIRKLREINLQQQQGYQKKIQSLQRMLKEQGFGAVQANRNYTPSYQPGSAISNEILKRDKQINRLSQENDRLRKQFQANPDRELINKRRGYFDEAADKDAQIMRLKRTIYELESKYDGKYFNDTRMRNEYELLQEENKKLKRELQGYYNANFSNKGNEVSPTLLEGIRYKKQYDVVARENEYLKSQVKQVNSQYTNYKQVQGTRYSGNPEVQILRKELAQSNQRNAELMEQLKRLGAGNTQGVIIPGPISSSRVEVNEAKRNSDYNLDYHYTNSKNNDTLLNSNVRQSNRARPHIFNSRTSSNINQSQTNQVNYINQINRQADQGNPTQMNRPLTTNYLAPSQIQMEEFPPSRGTINQSGVILNEEQQRHLRELQQQNQADNFGQDALPPNKAQEGSIIPSLHATEKKRGGYYDQFEIGNVYKHINGQRESTQSALNQSMQLVH